MTVRTTDLGGTDWSDGEVLYGADLNDTFGAVTDSLILSIPITEDDNSTNTSADYGTYVKAASFPVSTDKTIILQPTAIPDSFAGKQLKFTLYLVNLTNSGAGTVNMTVSYALVNDGENTSDETGNSGTDMYTAVGNTTHTLEVSPTHTTTGKTIASGDLLLVTVAREGTADANVNLGGLLLKVEAA